jgi:Secretion system C-terminal sorting domain/Bacterial pre-peptidase C-terminal domain
MISLRQYFSKLFKNSFALVAIIAVSFVNNSNAQNPDVITDVTVSAITNTSAQINWQYSDPMARPNDPTISFNPDAIEFFSVLYRFPNATSNISDWKFGGNTVIYVPTNSLVISGLLPNTTYVATVQVSASAGYTSPDIFPIGDGRYKEVTFTTGGLSVPNQLPVANAGPDQTITLPINSVTLRGSGTDPDGTISGYIWKKISGPELRDNTFANNYASTTLTNLSQGTYTFALTVMDNRGVLSAEDLVNFTVNPATTPIPTPIPTPVACTNDGFENNNTSASAAALTVGSTIQAKICPLTDIDFFSFSNASTRRNIRVTLSNLPSNYVLELFNPSGVLVASNLGANSQNKVVTFNTSAVGTYRVKVSSTTGAVVSSNNYSLLVETSKNSFAGARTVANDYADAETKDNLLVYPNPANDQVTIETLQEADFDRLSIFNLSSGTEVKTMEMTSNRITMSISDFKVGGYIFKAFNSVSGLSESKKVMVVK